MNMINIHKDNKSDALIFFQLLKKEWTAILLFCVVGICSALIYFVITNKYETGSSFTIAKVSSDGGLTWSDFESRQTLLNRIMERINDNTLDDSCIFFDKMRPYLFIDKNLKIVANKRTSDVVDVSVFHENYDLEDKCVMSVYQIILQAQNKLIIDSKLKNLILQKEEFDKINRYLQQDKDMLKNIATNDAATYYLLVKEIRTLEDRLEEYNKISKELNIEKDAKLISQPKHTGNYLIKLLSTISRGFFLGILSGLFFILYKYLYTNIKNTPSL